MTTFIIIYSKGRAIIRGGGIDFEQQPGRHQLEIAALDRVDAYKRAFEHFTRLGLSVSVERDPDVGNSLRFTPSEIDSIRESEASFSTDYTSGVRIQSIVKAL